MTEPFAYPPERHLLRDLPFETEAVAAGHARAHLEVTREVGLDGRVAAGPVVMVVDLLAGIVAAQAIAPDWVATASLTFHRRADAAVGSTVVVDARLVRAGSSTVVVGVDVSSGATVLGESLVTFVRLPRREGLNPDLSAIEPRFGERSGFGLPGSGLREPYDAAIGVGPSGSDGDPGATTTELTDYTRNSFGAMNGGVVASIAIASARRAATAAPGGPGCPVVDDLVVHYLGQGRTGPVLGSTTLLRGSSTSVSVRVELRDAGADRLMAIAHVGLSSGAGGREDGGRP